MQGLIVLVYPNFDTKYTAWLYLRERGILAPTNDDVDEMNSIMLSMITEDVETYMSCDILFNSNNCPPELLHSLKILGLPNHYLKLKVGAPVILVKNLNQSIGLCNNTRLVGTKMEDRFV